MVKEGFMSKVGFNLELKERMRDGQNKERRVLHMRRPGEAGRECSVLVTGRTAPLKSPKR